MWTVIIIYLIGYFIAVFISLYYTYSLESDITVRDLLNTIIFSSLSWAIVLAQAIELVCKYSTKFFDKSIIHKENGNKNI